MSEGDSAVMTVVRVQHPDGSFEKVVIRQCGIANLRRDPHAARTEFRILEFLVGHGLSVPEPLYLDESTGLLPLPYLVISCLDGKPQYDPPDPMGAVRQMAEFMASLHGIDAHELCDSVPAFTPLNSDVVLENVPVELGSILEAVESRGPVSASSPLALLHGDLWPGNMLWCNTTLGSVVDWEDAWFGDPLADLANLRAELCWNLGFDAIDELTSFYLAQTGFEDDNLPYWDLQAILRHTPNIQHYARAWDIEPREIIDGFRELARRTGTT